MGMTDEELDAIEARLDANYIFIADDGWPSIDAVSPVHDARALLAEVRAVRAERTEVMKLLDDEAWWVGGAWGDYGEPVVLARNVAERLGADYDRDREDRTADYAANYAEAVSAAHAAEQERNRLHDGIVAWWHDLGPDRTTRNDERLWSLVDPGA